jgi:hypothetical protein
LNVDPLEDGKQLAEFIQSLPQEAREAVVQRERADALADHSAFQTAFRNGLCYLCGQELNAFDGKNGCLHWLLKPPGFRKKDFQAALRGRTMMGMQAYLRWVANEAGFALNITDSGDLTGTGAIADVTIRYRNLEWSISCQPSDFAGHKTSAKSTFPHYHFQMRVGGRPFINYNDFHLPLMRSEVAELAALRHMGGRARHEFVKGTAINDLLKEDHLEAIVEGSKNVEDPETAPIRLQTMLIADEGTTISGEDIYRLIQSSKATGRTIASLAKELPNASASILVSEGPGVVEPAPRSAGRSKQKGKNPAEPD